MYQYRIIRKAWATLKFIGMWIFAILLLLAGSELLQVFIHLSEISAQLGYAFNIALVLGLSYGWYRIRRHRRRYRVLRVAGLRDDEHARQKELQACLHHLVTFSRRLATQRLLPATLSRDMLQKAHDLDDAMHHHPLRDDLQRGLITAREDIIRPAHRFLDDISAEITRSRALAIVQDVFQPPFPLMAPLVTLYHQATLTSEIADLYLPEPAGGEYVRVIADTWGVMTKGDFIRYGQRVFAGIETTNHLGPAGADIGQALSLVWLVHIISRVARNRCCTLHDWDRDEAITAIKENDLLRILRDVRESMATQVMPVMKAILRRHAPLPGGDPRAFVDQTWFTLIKSLDTLIMSMQAEADQRRQVQAVDRTRPVEHRLPGGEHVVDHHTRRKRRRKSRRWSQRFLDWLNPSSTRAHQ